MTALPVAALPVDPTPPPAPAPASTGSQFLSLVQNAPSQAPAAAPSAATRTATPSGTKPTSTSAPSSAGGGNKGNSTNQNANSGGANAGSGTTAAGTTAVVIPLLVPLVTTQPPAIVGGTSTAPAQSGTDTALAPLSTTQTSTAPVMPPTLTATTALNSAVGAALSATQPPATQPPVAPSATAAVIASAATAATQSFTALAAAAQGKNGTSPASTPNASVAPNGTTGTANASASAGSTTPGAPALPAIAGTLSMRVAANGVMLVSQPRAAMASFTPETAASQGKAGADASNSAPAGDAAHPTTPSTDGAIDQSSAQIVSSAAKNGIAATPPTAIAVSDKPAAAPSSPAADTNAAATSAAAVPPPAPVTSAASPATAAAAIAAPNLPILPQAVSEQVAVTLHQAVKAGDDHIQIQLQPADLGAVDVKLNINHDGRVTMVVSADRSDTLNLLKQDSSSLTQALRDAGLQADSGSLSFNLRGGYQFNQQQQPSYGASVSTHAYASRFADEAGGAVVGAPTTRSHNGSLDIHV
jgi:flagellar hook-length control protein FliK